MRQRPAGTILKVWREILPPSSTANTGPMQDYYTQSGPLAWQLVSSPLYIGNFGGSSLHTFFTSRSPAQIAEPCACCSNHRPR